MVNATKRKTSLALDARVLDRAKELGLNVSAVSEAALTEVIAAEHRKQWLSENAQSLATQAQWHEHNAHPLHDIIMAPGGRSWRN